ncbi:MAG: sulfite exporter TauE/SafE family protein [Fimbriiglobus sp.]|nr:sulfite exporter TauE/SafE family protein [Fimbriiglobus sp.]
MSDVLVTYAVVCGVALLASGLTFFSGFGLGTLLLPAFALFVPVDRAIALTAIVHFLNGLFKLALVGRQADRRVVVRFGLPAIAAAFAGAGVLVWLTGLGGLFDYTLFGRRLEVTPVKAVVGVLLLVFAAVEVVPRLRDLEFDPRYLPLGGAVSGFFGGLSGMQGALRSAFLVRAGLSKEAFIGTGVVVACLVDVSRLALYSRPLVAGAADLDYGLLTAAVLTAWLGSVLGNRYLKKITMRGVQRVVAAMLVGVGVGLAAGVL